MSSSTFLFGRTARIITALKQNPTIFNSVTGCILFSGSDLLAQKVEQRNNKSFSNNENFVQNNSNNDTKDFHLWRFISAGTIGIVFGGFVYPFAYAKLDVLWKGVNFMSVLKKSIVEIATVGIFVNSISISCRGLLVGRTTDDVAKHTISEMPSVTINDIKVWLPYNLLAFSIIPIYIRPITTSIMEALWQTYISLCSHNYHTRITTSSPRNLER